MGGRANQGKGWEFALEQQHDLYRRDQLACVFRSHPPIKVLSRADAKGRFTACWAGDGPPDFLGCLSGSGRAVAFDAKETAEDRFSLSMIKRHQAKALEAVSPLGFAFVALRQQGEDWVLPWRQLGPLYWHWAEGHAKRGEASLTRDDVVRIGWQMPRPADWLRAVPDLYQ